jgi:hypothetical protein
MWRILIASQKGKDFKIEYSKINIHGSVGNAKWEAYYNLSKNGKTCL